MKTPAPSPHTICPSCGDTLIPEQTSRLGTCLGTGACIRIEKFRRQAAANKKTEGTAP